ncbi:LVIVD repeat-containing protein [Ramlibacter sp. MMS24-I3-19]|uniref:LVIVD repeat-containing protein n=1 Tax=Ramlibacter sp. MMS24-I3-19 TaxID=3416606 RepID=UPI003D00D56A
MRRRASLLFVMASLLAACAHDASRGTGTEDAVNMRLVGQNDLQGRSAYQPTIQHQGRRWIAYIGHHGDRKINPLTGVVEDNGTSVVDVTDPAHTRYLAHIPGEPGKAELGGAQMVRVCTGSQLPRADKSRFYMLRTYGNQAQQVWDVTVPEHPSLLTTVVAGLKGTHKNFWECDTGIAYLVSGDPAWRTSRMTKIYDLSDPQHPVFIRDFGLPGQQPGATGPVPVALHGPISIGPKGNRVYFGYGTSADGVLQIVDRQKLLTGPKEPTPENLLAPQVGRLDMPPINGAHTVFPLLRVDVPEFARNFVGHTRDFVVITDEAIQKECMEARQMVWVVDITTESKPFGVANYTVPEASGHYCSQGGRFGTHSSNENMTPLFYNRLMFFAHFNAGVRVLDVRNPMNPREVAHFVPAVTDNTVVLEAPASAAGSKLPFTAASDRRAIQTNNVEVDDRGYIYIVDRANTGLHILELTGPARDIADWRAAVRD